MRRSAAPSQQSTAKRTKFTVPYKHIPNSTINQQMPGRSSRIQNDCLISPSALEEKIVSVPFSHESTSEFQVPLKPTLEIDKISTKETKPWCQDSLNLEADVNDSKPCEKNSQDSIPTNTSPNKSTHLYAHGHCNKRSVKLKHSLVPSALKTCFNSPVLVSFKEAKSEGKSHINLKEVKSQHSNLDVTDPSAINDSGKKGYFSVVWCKLSKKKHKKWEGDAVLLTHGRSATLYDMDGKEIGKGAGYKSSELESLKEDESLVIGGKEIQVMGLLSEEQFKSGKCFTGARLARSESANCHDISICLKSTGASRSFTNPLVASHNKENAHSEVKQSTLLPRFDPSGPGALVMPRPDTSHQLQYNRQRLPLVDVVVDPHLAVHLRPHQREGVVFLYECISGMRNYSGMGAILADDMGLGKTLQCITLIWTLLKQGSYGGRPILKRVIIITPGSLVKNWSQEFRKWLGPERIHVFVVAGENKIQDYTRTSLCPVMIISYEMFMRGYDIIKHIPFDLMVCDEGHRLKNTTIKTTSLIMSLEIRRRIVLSGTPIQNDLQEFFSVADFCNPGILGSSVAFRRVYETPIVASQQPNATEEEVVLGEERASELARITRMFVLRRTQEINNKYLPPKVELVLFCRPSYLQQVIYGEILGSSTVRSCLMGHGSLFGAGAGSLHLQAIAALKQLCNHPALLANKIKTASVKEQQDSIYANLREHYEGEQESCLQLKPMDSGKLAILAELLKTMFTLYPEEKIVLVSNHTKTLDMLQQFCCSIGYTFVRLDGQTPTAQRQDIVTRFNNNYGQESIFLLSSKAGGVGLNLVGASRLVLYDIDWNPANDLQAMARVWRDGQKKKVFIYRLLTAGSIEEKIYQRQISKQGLSGTVIDFKPSEIQFSQEDLKDLFSFNTSTECDTHSLLDCLCKGEGSTLRDNMNTVQISSEHQQKHLSGTSAELYMARNLSMSQLLDWKHLKGSSTQIQKEWCLGDTTNIPLSFLFWNETHSKSIPS